MVFLKKITQLEDLLLKSQQQPCPLFPPVPNYSNMFATTITLTHNSRLPILVSYKAHFFKKSVK